MDERDLEREAIRERINLLVQKLGSIYTAVNK